MLTNELQLTCHCHSICTAVHRYNSRYGRVRNPTAAAETVPPISRRLLGTWCLSQLRLVSGSRPSQPGRKQAAATQPPPLGKTGARCAFLSLSCWPRCKPCPIGARQQPCAAGQLLRGGGVRRRVGGREVPAAVEVIPHLWAGQRKRVLRQQISVLTFAPKQVPKRHKPPSRERISCAAK